MEAEQKQQVKEGRTEWFVVFLVGERSRAGGRLVSGAVNVALKFSV